MRLSELAAQAMQRTRDVLYRTAAGHWKAEPAAAFSFKDRANVKAPTRKFRTPNRYKQQVPSPLGVARGLPLIIVNLGQSPLLLLSTPSLVCNRISELMRPKVTRSNASGSYEPTISGYSQMPEDRNRETKAIVVRDPWQYGKLKAIEKIDPIDLEPWGRLPNVPHRDTKRFLWQLRTPEGLWPEVWCRINEGARDVVFEVQFSRHDYCVAHVPIESWEHRTCDAEAVRAAIQQDYLNLLRSVPYHISIVQRGMKSLPLHPLDELKKNPRCKWFKPLPLPPFAREQATYDAPRSSTSSKTAAWVQLQASDSERHHQRFHQPRSPISSSSSPSGVPQYPEVYAYQHHHNCRLYTKSSSLSSNSSRTLVESDYTYDYEDNYSDASSSTVTYHNPPPPLRSEKHISALEPSSRSDSDGSSIYSERRAGWRTVVEF